MRPILRPRTEGVSPVVAEILLVAITVVLAAVVYLMASGILTGHTESIPVVAFAPGVTFQSPSDNVSLAIGGASQNLYPFNYRFNLQVDGVYGAPTEFAATRTAANITVGTSTYRVTWTDVDGAGTLTQGDEITVTGSGIPLPSNTAFQFILLWHDGTTITSTSWHT